MTPSVLRFESNLGASFELHSERIVRKEKGIETVLSLSEILRVRTLVIGGGGVAELTARDGGKFVVVSSREDRGMPLRDPARSEYRTFLVELHGRLAANHTPVEFVTGYFFKKRYDPRAIPEWLLP